MDRKGRVRGSGSFHWLPVFALLFGAGIIALGWLLDSGSDDERLTVAESTNTEGRQRGGLSRLWQGLAQGTPATPGPKAGSEASTSTPTVPLVIRVIGPEGPAPAPGTTVFLDDRPLGITDSTGRLVTSFPLDETVHDAWAERGEYKAEAYRLRESNLPAGELTLVLRGTGSLRGVVIGPAGEPTAGAEITIRPTAADPTTTDSSGVFRHEGLPEGGYRILARTDGTQASVRIMIVAGTDQEVIFRLEPIEPVIGTVVDETGTPLAGMKIRGFRTISGFDTTFSDENGRFELVAFHREFALIAEGDGRRGSYRGLARPDLEIVARPTTSLTIQVRFPDGDPVRDGAFELEKLGAGFAPPMSAVRAPESEPGTYLFEGLAAGEWKVFLRGHRQGALSDLGRVTLAESEARVLEIVLPAGTEEHRGRVLDGASREPVAGARLFLGQDERMVRYGERGPHTRSASTADDGSFVFEQVGAEERFLFVTAEGYDPQALALISGEEALVLLEGKRRVRGVVVDERRLPLMDFQLEERHVTASDGAFDVPVSGGTKRVRISSLGYTEVVLELPAGPGDVDLGEVMLTVTGPTRILVLGPKGQPAAGAKVWIRPVAPRREGTHFDTLAPATGRDGWTQALLRPERYSFRAEHHLLGRTPRPDQETEIGGNESIKLQLQVGAWIYGNAGGPDRMIRAMPDGRASRSGADGSYRLGPIITTEIYLVLAVEGSENFYGLRTTPRFTVKPGEEKRYDFDDSAHATVRVGCRVEGSGVVVLSPLSGEWVGRPFFNHYFDTDRGPGCPFLLEWIPAGPYKVRIELEEENEDRRTLGPQEIQVEAGQTIEVDLGE